MKRIESLFAGLRVENRKALIPYLVAGDPAPAQTVPLLHALVEAGADLIELGIPFSDPMADGPVIQQACERALTHGVGLRDVLKLVAAFRKDNGHTPLILMGYLNPIEAMGFEAFAAAAVKAGVDGVLVVDLPVEEAAELNAALQTQDLGLIMLVAPTTSAARLAAICEMARGFVYYVSLKGVTGTQNVDPGALAGRLAELRAATRLPLGVGFGIRDAKTAAAVAAQADAVVIGSALVAQLAEQAADPITPAKAFIQQLRTALDAVR